MKKTATIPITEKQFSSQVESLLKIYHWRYYCVYEQSRYARRSSKGFPDYIAIRDTRVLAIEVKSEKGILSDAQIEWLEALQGTGKVEVEVWRPSDFDRITEVLR